MRIALISDIHGNYTALEAVLEDIKKQVVDQIICLGDVATIGPQPKQVLERLRTPGCACITGNHDAALLDMDAALRYQIAPPLISTLYWCIDQIADEDLDYLDSFKPLLEVPLGGDADLLCFHGSPRSNTGLILATTPPEDIDELLSEQTAPVMAGGHSHIQMLRQHNGNLIINPGSVGHPFLNTPPAGVPPTLLRWAEYAIINREEGVLSVNLRRVSFDLAAFCEVLSKSDNPMKEWLLQQYATTQTN